MFGITHRAENIWNGHRPHHYRHCSCCDHGHHGHFHGHHHQQEHHHADPNQGPDRMHNRGGNIPAPFTGETAIT